MISNGPEKTDQAFVLHQRPMYETSQLIEVLTKEHGRFSLLAKGVRRPTRKKMITIQVFLPLQIVWRGKAELKQLIQAEMIQQSDILEGKFLFAGMYLNELILRTVPRFDPYLAVYENYQETIRSLSKKQPLEPTLRIFEKSLLHALGYELNFSEDILHQPIDSDRFYRYVIEHGFVPMDGFMHHRDPFVFQGKDIIAIACHALDDSHTLYKAKHLMRFALSPLLGTKPLKSREMFEPIKIE